MMDDSAAPQQADATAPSQSDTSAGGASFDGKWYAPMVAGLPAEKAESLSKWADRYESPSAYAEAVLEQRRHFDSRIPLPSKDSKPEDVDRVMRALGKPEKPDGYDWKPTVPEAYTPFEHEQIKGFREIAHRTHMTGDQYRETMAYLDKVRDMEAQSMTKAMEAAQAKSRDALMREFRSEELFKENLAISSQTAREVFGESYQDIINAPTAKGYRLGDDPDFIKGMARLGRARLEDVRVMQLKQSGGDQDLQAQIDAIRTEAAMAGKSTADPEYFNRLKPLYDRRSGKRA